MILIQIHLRMMGDVEGRSVGAKWRLLLTPMFQVMTEHALEGVPLSGLMRRRAGNVIIGGKTEVKIDHVLSFFSMNDETCLLDLIYMKDLFCAYD